MKTSKLILPALVAIICALNASAQRGTVQTPKEGPSLQPPPVYYTTVPQVSAPATTTTAGAVYVYDQKPVAGRAPLVTPQQAQIVVDKFKAAYSKPGAPRMLVYVNRELVDEHTGLKLIARTEKTDRAKSEGANPGSTEKVTGENRYRLTPRKDTPMADKQTVRDVERLFGRPLRLAGASLADQRVASQLIADRNQERPTTEGDQARKDREAISKIADIAIEILITSKNMTVAGISGEQTFAVPDIQATAIRLSDARIVGQASTSDILGNAGSNARNYDVREVTEATALALMEDMLTSADAPTPRIEAK